MKEKMFNKNSKILIFFILTFTLINSYAWNPFGPKNYEDCVLDGIKNAKSDQAANAVMFACRKKFPDKSPPLPTFTYDPPGVRLFSGLGMFRPSLNSLINNLNITSSRVAQTGTNTYGVKSYDYGHHLSVEITNRNDFPINNIEIGLISRNGQCTWDDKNYTEIHQCSGQASTRTSGVFRCDIPRIENRKVSFCITGFGIYATEAETDSFKKRHGIPNRQ